MPRPWPILPHRTVAQENTPEQKGVWTEEENKYCKFLLYRVARAVLTPYLLQFTNSI